MEPEELDAKSLLALSTFDDAGRRVTRSVWFALDAGRIVAVSLEGHEAERLAADVHVEFGAIDDLGETPDRVWRGTARALHGAAAHEASRLIGRKYGLRRRFFRSLYWFVRIRAAREAYLEIWPETRPD